MRDTVEDLDSKRSVPCGDSGERSSLRDVEKDINRTDSCSASARGSSGTLYADQVRQGGLRELDDAQAKDGFTRLGTRSPRRSSDDRAAPQPTTRSFSSGLRGAERLRCKAFHLSRVRIESTPGDVIANFAVRPKSQSLAAINFVQKSGERTCLRFILTMPVSTGSLVKTSDQYTSGAGCGSVSLPVSTRCPNCNGSCRTSI